MHEIFRQDVPAHYTFVSDAATEAARAEGAGSRIVGVELQPKSPAVVRAGQAIAVRIAYDIRGEQGLMPWVMPVTTCRMSYDGTTTPLKGSGATVKNFVIAEKCALKKIKVGLSNAAHEHVDERDFDVRFDIVDKP